MIVLFVVASAVAVVSGLVHEHSQAPGAVAYGASHCSAVKADVAIAQDVMNGLTSIAAEAITSRHAVLVVPGEPMEVGEKLAAEAYSLLPRAIKDGKYGTTFTKFVVVGHGEHPEGPLNIVLGDDVCGEAGYSDASAVQFLRSTVTAELGRLGPPMADCKTSPDKCPEPYGPTLEQQMPYLDAISNSSLKGNLVPIMIEGQSVELGVHVGNALGLLVGSGGVWEAERVLFVFGGDLSVGLDATKAKSCDERTVEILATEGAAATATHFKQLWQGDTSNGDCGHKALPRSYSTLIAATKTAASLELTATRTKVSRIMLPSFLGKAPDDDDSAVLGYSHILYWKDERPQSERMSRGNILRSAAYSTF